MSFQIGDTIGDYEVVGLLGAGGMGTVFRVRNVLSDRVEALKILLPDLANAPQLAERFLREIKIQARLSHPNIATLHTALRVNNQLLMLMEYVEGTTLERRLTQGPLELWQGVNFIAQVAGALAYAHEHGVVHRDIKPANIMITPEGVVKLMDFGIASAAKDRRLTQTGAAVGSLYYMSPEQISGGSPDARSDLYSLGVTFYEVATGQRPFRGDSDYTIMTAHLHHHPPPPMVLNPHVPSDLSSVITKLLAKNPDERFASAAELRATLISMRDRRPMEDTIVLPSQTSTPVPPGAKAWDPALLDRIRREYAVFIGPMAKVLVDRTARKCETVEQLYEKLAAEIPSAKDREKFLAGKK